MATLSSLVDDVYGMLYGMAQVERPKEDTLATAVADENDVEWRFTTEPLWQRDDFCEMDDGELVYITEDHPSGADVTVRRAQRGTTAAGGFAQDDVVRRNPTYPRYMIERFINETVDNDLWPLVWNVMETTVSYTVGTTTYEMPTDCGLVLQIYQVDLDSTQRFYPIDISQWEFVPVVNATESTNQNFLRLNSVHDASETVYITYAGVPSSSALDDLSSQLEAMVPWQVVGKLLAGTRITPARTAPGRSRPVANQSGSQLRRDFEAYNVQFRRMRQDENRRLARKVPTQRRFMRNRVRLG